MSDVGKKIKSFRQSKSWSQADMAASLKISVPAFSKIESDATDISMSRLKQIADLMEVHVRDLISSEEKHDPTLLQELEEAKKIIIDQAFKINQLQEYIIKLYEQLQSPDKD